MIETASGKFQMYFSGMATPSKTKNEIASKVLVQRKIRINPTAIQQIFGKDSLQG